MEIQHRRSTINAFTRQECIKLTGCTSSRLSYLEKTRLIVPTRVGNNERPAVLFTWEQLIAIKAIKNLRQDVSLKVVRKIVDYLNESGLDDSLRDRQMIAIADEVFWVRQDWSDFSDRAAAILRTPCARKGRAEIRQYALLVIPPFDNVVDELWQAAQDPEVAKVVDFEEFKRRAKAQPFWI